MSPFCLSPAYAALQGGGGGQYVAVGGTSPLRYYVNSDTTCDLNGEHCSSIDPTTGAFTAGTGTDGYVVVVALDLALIPGHSGPGAAAATVISELFLTAGCFFALATSAERRAPGAARTGPATE